MNPCQTLVFVPHLLLLAAALASQAGALQVSSAESAEASVDSAKHRGSASLWQAAWEGLDNKPHTQKELDALVELGCEDIENKTAQRYIMLGPQDSGTNLLHALLRQNYPTQICLIKDAIWKHANSGAESIYKRLHASLGPELGNIVLLHTTRSPLSQVASWRKAPYELETCVTKHILKPCAARMSAMEDRAVISAPHQNDLIQFASVMDVYNKYMEEYATLHKLGGFKDVVAVTYEDMVYSPQQVLEDIVSHFDHVAQPAEFRMISTAAKSHGYAVGREDALKKLQQRTYMTEFSPQLKEKLCGLLDKDLVQGIVQGQYLESTKRRSYLSDCDHGAD
eukprot:CAMPEP_0178410246 /NCGR_PEP_ID=MMETSP0689_2-20121128/20879_1 /TAXON_ID=160604 /ORGANISM="Amphidinium massartii, Strain CS-259" /LENGTH=337 /DNA_ID=CAMNT_0020031413 /DNA_START=70 /DNA_END=1083 /DNA_ORIENTATION=+